jgi:hypothetical protein
MIIALAMGFGMESGLGQAGFGVTAASTTIDTPPSGNPHYPLKYELTNQTDHSITVHRWGGSPYSEYVVRATHCNTLDYTGVIYVRGPGGGGTSPCWSRTDTWTDLQSNTYLGIAGSFAVVSTTEFKNVMGEEEWSICAEDIHYYTVS